MRELIFITSNATKLAHARHVAERFPVKIQGFRQQTYHANYDEPRLGSRGALLDASYRSALQQFDKAGISTETMPFFLEDTSVRIEALSSSSEDVPGPDIKFWIEQQDFGSLDLALKARGNDRRAMVRSDVLLHIPHHLRSSWNIDTEYIIFVGIQMGTVIISEIEYVPNLVFPWLDDRSFNKWFQPEGMDRPLGALDIGRADQVDFRGKSFNQLFEFLREKRYLGQDFQQYELQLHDRPNLILCGYTCAGKTTASQHLALGFGYLHIEASDFMHLGYLQRHGFRKSVSISDFAEQALEQKPAIAAEKVADHIEENSAAPVVVSGFRSPEEVWYLKRRLSLRGKEFKTVFIDAPEQIRFERLRKRMRPGDNISLADFCLRDRQQDRMGLGRILSNSSTSVVTNQETLSEFLQKVDRVIEAPRPEDLDVEEALLLVRTLKDIKLEDAILLGLLAVWRPDETRLFFTTTQIAALVKATLPRIVPKHKDNVSRYFNQDYYAYYEIDNTSSRTARGYRLSNTGYGRAVRELRRIRSSLLSEERSSDRDGSLT